MDKFVRGVSLVFSERLRRFLLGVLVLENSLRGYGADVYTQVRHVGLDSLDTLATATLIPALITTAILIVRAPGQRRLPLVALILLSVVLGTSIAVNLPINADQAGWAVQNPPADSGRDPRPLAGGPSGPDHRRPVRLRRPRRSRAGSRQADLSGGRAQGEHLGWARDEDL